MTAPSAILKAAIKPLSPDQRAPLGVAGIDPRAVRRAALGQRVNAVTHLKLCALIGIDPMTGLVVPACAIGDLHAPSLSMALRMKRIAGNLDLRKAAKRARISYSTLGRIERGEAVSIDSTLAACRWLGRRPFDFVSPDVSREAVRSAA